MGVTSFAAVALLAISAVVATPLLGQQGGPVIVDSVVVQGNQRLSDPVILGTFGLQTGVAISYRDIQRGVKALWDTDQFSDVRVRALGTVNPVTIVVEVEERPLMRRVEIRGLEHVNPQEVRDTTGLASGLPYSPSSVAEATRYIRSELAKEGIPFARIDEIQSPVPDRDNEIDLILEVSEGQRVTIADVVVRGNQFLTEADVIGSMSTRPEGFWWFRPGSYDETTFLEDLDSRIPDLYASRGFLDFEVQTDTLVIDPITGKARVELEVSEGPRYAVRSFEIQGNSRFPTDQLEQYFAPEQGGILQTIGFGGDAERVRYFDAIEFESATQQIRELYNNEGYLYARIEPFLEKHDVTEGEQAEVTVGWQIVEGQPAYVNRVSIEGNDFTHDDVIRERVFLLPGDVYSQARLIQSYQQISALGFFETPMDFPSIEPDPTTGDVDITFHVEERQTGAINFGTAVGGGTGLSGFLGYDQPNLFGQAKSGSLRWDFGRFINNFTLTYSDPAIVGSRISGTVSLFNSRNRFFQFNSGQWRRIGGSIRLGFPVPNALRTRLFVGYSLVRTVYDLRSGTNDTSLFGLPDGSLSTLSVGITRTTLDHPLFPTSGSRQGFETQFSGGILGGDAGFSKYELDGQWFVPVGQVGGGTPGSRPIRFALGFGAKLGAVSGDANNFPFERFWMGGVQFGQRLRGYDETSVTPEGFFPEGSGQIRSIDRLGDAFLALTAEYAIRFNDNLSLSLFYEAGNVWRDPGDLDPTRLFRGAGLGVQLVTPFGPLGLDYAYGFDKPIPGWQLHFRLGPGF